MVHLQAPGRPYICLIGRGYSGVPQNQPAYDHKLQFDIRWDVLWYPLEKHAELVGLLGGVPAQDFAALLYMLKHDYGVETVVWERDDGEKKFKDLTKPGGMRTLTKKRDTHAPKNPIYSIESSAA